MTVAPGSSPGRNDTDRALRPGASMPETPRRADGVELIGEMAGSGYKEPPSLARRADGQTIQLTGLLYLVLRSIDGQRSYDEIAERVTAGFGRTVTADNVRTLVDQQLRPMGLLTRPDGSQPEVRKSNPLLALRFKFAVSDPERTRRLTSPFARLFHPLVVVPVLAAFAAVCWWVFMEKGLASATYQAFDRPGLLLLVVGVTVLSAGFHEFGHAAAARRGGATPGVMGAGLYLVWPAFYTDVTDSYRLGRGGRVRTDLGGLYFNAIVAVAITGIWWATRYDALLLVVATQILQMLHQLTPLVRFDGYHVLADVTGVPDLFQRIKPTLLGILPWRWRHPESTVLKPWARLVVTTWVLVVVPVLAFSLFTMVVALPRLLGTAWASMRKQSTLLERAWGDADFLMAAARVIAIIAVTFPALAIVYILTRVVRSVTRSVWRRTAGRPFRRALAGLVAAGLVAGLVVVWWPRPGTYRPIQPYEEGTLAQAAVILARPATSGLVENQYGQLTTAWADDEPRPTAEHPQLALVLIPRGPAPVRPSAVPASDTSPGALPSEALPSSAPTVVPGTPSDPALTGLSGAAQPWVFPFNKPLVPGEGDNQSMAVNTTDNMISYDVAFALVWVTDDSPALNRNEAYAFASCKNCAAVSVAFQVVLVTGENHIAAPQNISAAVNYDCVNCLTFALATQLFLTLDGPLSEQGQQRIADLWQEIADLGRHITEVPLSEIRSRLTDYEQRIQGVIEEEQGPLAPQPSASGSPSASPGDGGTPGSGDPSGTATGSPTGTPSGSGSEGASGSPSDGRSTGSASPSTSPSSSPSTSASSGSSSPGSSSASASPKPSTAPASPKPSSAPSSPKPSTASPSASRSSSASTATSSAASSSGSAPSSSTRLSSPRQSATGSSTPSTAKSVAAATPSPSP